MTALSLDKSGRITIPTEMLAKLGLKPGDSLALELRDGALVIQPTSPARQKASPAAPEKPGDPPVAVRHAIARKNLQTPMQFIKGIGPKMAELLEKRGIKTVGDALYLLPLRYEDRRELIPVARLRPGTSQVFQGRILAADSVTTRGGRRVFEAMVGDASGQIALKWFNANAVWMKRTWKVGREGIFTGEVSVFGHQREVHHPDVEWLEEGTDVREIMAADPANFGRIVPVYPLTEGLQQKPMRKVMREVVARFLDDVENHLPASLLTPHDFMPVPAALRQVHMPPADADLAGLNEGRSQAHRSLAFEEFFFWELGLALKRRGITLEEGIAFQVTHRYTKQLARLLPFELTAAQRRVLSEIKADMMAPHPMHRLVQGDVGCGKTLVALMAALVAVENDYQVAIMAPTEILAEQHWLTIHRWCAELGIETVLLTAGMKGRAKSDAMARVTEGSARIVIGTHAVIQDKVEFKRLGLGIIDEQHRFGVLQRGILKKKGSNPDILVMTATPIPRTLAMTLFGDLSLSVIDELPPGRTPVETRVYFESRRAQVYDMIRREIGQGRQAYLIYPLVEETEKSDLRAAAQMAEHLRTDIFPGLRVALLHGRMSPEEKEAVMGSFKARETDILVATTVIEVGIDVPNATVMVIEHAERFGLSQLHQLRGRVGRGQARSYCILLTSGKLSEDGEKRLHEMEKTNDGFRIAEADLEIRGPGDFLGTRQSGMPDFRIANILRDGQILETARKAAFELLAADPELSGSDHVRLREELVSRWGQRLELGSIG
ncbi:ATP-dependent DNA helicase RecG [Geobacter sp. SVR]|uniref:ATP-dependent DNA helicase RecG n=1 Tax=Geobacter sp. SVR TaxID=2495594 RepID=UPI00143EFBBC|nr:ATP-dependent DNA helicase RecG [Geobacter sp. SVR]BCS53943.1 ATP-dependent DNA helicase RecG [Geobacter sp. SVR]GCF86276.1 ATP-dependent DNA helicase RecG [Geobacter sp. SVR]